MMKTKDKATKIILFLLVTIIVIPNFVKANTYLNENATWQANLTAIHFATLVLGDLDSDNDLDLVSIGRHTTFHSKVYTNNGTSFVESTNWQQNLTNVHYGSITLGDIDNDGDLDLALIGCSSGGGTLSACDASAFKSFIYINNRTSIVENLSWGSNLTKSWKGTIAFGDVNNDGKLDLALNGQSESGKVAKIYINNGTSLVENLTWQQNLTALFESSLAWGDVDNDNDLDLIMVGDAGVSDEKAKVYINNGTSLVENSTWQTNLLGTEHSSISFGDYDNNGNLDLTLIGHTNNDEHEIYNNTGTTFQLMQSEQTGVGPLIGIYEGSQAFGDYDNDGDLDLITTGKEGHTTLYLYNITSNSFTNKYSDPESDILEFQSGSYVVWGDFDDDNDLDLIGTGYLEEGINDDRIRVYTNSITTPNIAPNPPTSFSASFANNKMTFSWNNGSDTETPPLGLYYNLRVGTSNGSHDTVSGVYGGGDDNGYFGNMMQRKSISLNIVNQTYYWAVQTIDTALKAGSWSREQRYHLDTTDPSITVNSPANNTNSSNSTITFNATASDNVRLENVTLFANFSGAYGENETNTSGINNTVYLFTKNISDGSYIWSIRACAYYGSNCTFSNNRTIMIDTTYPTVTVLAPLNNSLLETSNVTVRAQFSDSNIVNCQVKNDSGDWYSMDNDGVTSGTANYTFTSLLDGNHNLTINCTDILLSTIKTINFSIDTSGQDIVKPNIAITLPRNNSYLSSSSVTLNVNFNDSNNVDCQAKINTNNWQNMDNDGATAGIANYTFSSVSDGNHSINVNCTDSAGNNATSNVSFTVDTVYPVIKLLSPANGTTESSSSTVTFRYNVTDVAIGNCSLIINNAVSSIDTSVTVNISQSISKSLSNAAYNWSINCTDRAGNTNASNETRRITVSYSAPSDGGGGGGGSSGGGGGGGGAGVSAITNLDIKPTFTTVGYTAKQTQGDTATFTIAGTTYTAEVTKLKEDSVTISVAGASSVFKSGDSKEFDVDNDGHSDISVGLSKIAGGRAEVVYRLLARAEEKEAVEEKEPEKLEQVEEEIPIEQIEEGKPIWVRWFLAISIMVLTILIAIYVAVRKYLKSSK